MSASNGSSVRLSWIVIFLLLTLGLAAAAILFVGGGDLLTPSIVPAI
ncbi:MAG: hypothetical protein PPP58_11315 [Natronomonas sp.]